MLKLNKDTTELENFEIPLNYDKIWTYHDVFLLLALHSTLTRTTMH